MAVTVSNVSEIVVNEAGKVSEVVDSSGNLYKCLSPIVENVLCYHPLRCHIDVIGHQRQHCSLRDGKSLKNCRVQDWQPIFEMWHLT